MFLLILRVHMTCGRFSRSR